MGYRWALTQRADVVMKLDDDMVNFSNCGANSTVCQLFDVDRLLANIPPSTVPENVVLGKVHYTSTVIRNPASSW